jgi:proline iminopeptidase
LDNTITKIIDTEGGKTCCYIKNPNGKGIPIVVLHGGPGFSSDPILSNLLGIKSPMYFYDQFGCGGSDKFDDIDKYSVETFVNQLEDVIVENKLDTVILLGMCWGAGLATAYASIKGVEGIKAIILSSPFLSTPMWEDDQMVNLSLLPNPDRATLMQFEKNGLYSNGYRRALIPYFQHYYFTRGDSSIIYRLVFGFQPEVYRIMWGNSELLCCGRLKNFDLTKELGKIDVPVLLISGDRDTVRTETMKKYQDMFPRAQLAIVPASGHMIYNEQPGIVKKIIQSFVSDVNNYSKKEVKSMIMSAQ